MYNPSISPSLGVAGQEVESLTGTEADTPQHGSAGQRSEFSIALQAEVHGSRRSKSEAAMLP